MIWCYQYNLVFLWSCYKYGNTKHWFSCESKMRDFIAWVKFWLCQSSLSVMIFKEMPPPCFIVVAGEQTPKVCFLILSLHFQSVSPDWRNSYESSPRSPLSSIIQRLLERESLKHVLTGGIHLLGVGMFSGSLDQHPFWFLWLPRGVLLDGKWTFWAA